MTVQIFSDLPDSARLIRIAVFMEEQGFVDEFDALDETAVHAVMLDGDLPVATCRFWPADDGWHVGRLAVIKAYRGRGIGRAMLEAAEDHIRALGGNSLSLHAQCRAQAFYQKCGYQAFGETDYEEGVAHVQMFKKLI